MATRNDITTTPSEGLKELVKDYAFAMLAFDTKSTYFSLISFLLQACLSPCSSPDEC
jgi:hypothetical protein